jgi:hypothetical protein
METCLTLKSHQQRSVEVPASSTAFPASAAQQDDVTLAFTTPSSVEQLNTPNTVEAQMDELNLL